MSTKELTIGKSELRENHAFQRLYRGESESGELAGGYGGEKGRRHALS